jgi:hypothetical protein
MWMDVLASCAVCCRRRLVSVVWRKWKGYRRVLLAKAAAVHGQVQYAACRGAFRAWGVTLERSRRHYSRRLVQFKMARRVLILRGCLQQWREFLHLQELERDIDSRVDSEWAQLQSWLK